MTKKIGDKKIGGIKSTGETNSVEGAAIVGGVGGVQPTSGVGRVGSTTSVGKRKSTRTMTLEEREQLFKMINEEADQLFGKSGLDPQKRQLVEDAVKMAVDSGLLDEEE